MKHLLIALIALTMALGVGCKKSEVESVKPSTEVKKLTIGKSAVAVVDEGGIGGYPGGANTYPHNTGLCYCGEYSVCHPIQHNPSCPAALGTGGCTGCPKSGGSAN
jgi:hypothetical protein